MSNLRRSWRALPVAGALALLGCAAPGVTTSVPPETLAPAQIVAGCCDSTGAYPDWMLELADSHTEAMRQAGLVQLRPGRLVDQDEALARLQAALRPMDVLFFHSPNRVSGLLIPGHFTHGAIYIGSEAQLRAAGLWHLPELRPYQDLIAAGATYMEAVDGGVRLIGPEVVLDTDAAVVLRPQAMQRGAALARGLALMGTPFDMRFDAGDPSEMFCAELIDNVYAAAPLPRVAVLGRETIVIDAIIAGSLSGELPFSLVGYVAASPGGGAAILSARDLAWDIRFDWPDRPRPR